jgi:uncharacterized protein YjiK
MRPAGATRILLAFALLAGLTLPSVKAQARGVLSHYRLDGPPSWRFELPKTLAEISGLAYTSDGQLLAHGDEQAIIWRIDPVRRAIAGQFGFTHRGRVIAGDFEDIQVVGERVFLLASSGELIEGRSVADGKVTEAVRRGPGLGGTCEAEGLAWDEATRSLLVLCKQVQSRRWRHQVVILAISVDTWRFEPKPRLAISEQELKRVAGVKRFNGSALVRYPGSGTFLLLAGPERAYAEVDASGRVLGGGRLDPDRHRQPEGIAIAPDSTILISDEAAGKRATITGYAYRP